MRTVVGSVVVLCAATPASAQQDQRRACVEVHSDRIDTCLPTVSPDGQTIAVASTDPDGGRGAPNLTVLLLPASGGNGERVPILTVEETGGSGEIDDALRAKLAPRIAKLEQRLAGSTPLRAVSIEVGREAPPTQTFHFGDLVIGVGGKQVVATRGKQTARLALPAASTGRCRGANAPFVEGLWAPVDPAVAWLLVEIAYRGNDTCSEPAPVWRVLKVPPPPGAPKTSTGQIEQLLDREMTALKGDDDLEKVFAPGAGIVYSTRGDDAKQPFVTPDQMTNALSIGMGILAPPVMKDRAITLSKDGVTAWISMTVKVKAFAGDTGQQLLDYRVSEVAQLYPRGWRIVGAMWSMATRHKTLGDPERAAEITLGKLPSKVEDSDLDVAFQKVLVEGLDPGGEMSLTAVRKDLIAIGSGKGERTAGGAKFAKTWNVAWEGHAEIDGDHIAQVTESGTTAWVIANIQWKKTKGKTSWEVPIRLMFVFTRDTKDGDWELAHAHLASSEPYGS